MFDFVFVTICLSEDSQYVPFCIAKAILLGLKSYPFVF